ncbi:MAG TPA: DUF1501 domain-containing protein [Gemmatimonadaceae bacterium]|nr:DUF1501 domain-containing protein [Gemmatimonadaceae bacterium]
MNRRVFVKSGAMALVTMGLTPSFLRRSAYGAQLVKGAGTLGNTRGKVLICIFQRGAADALNVVVPHGEKAYYKIRSTIAIPRPTAATTGAAQAAIDLDGFFGLHPALAPMKPLWDRGILAPVVAVGSPSSSRSHFDAQDYMESATPDVKSTPDGWLNRYLATKGTCEECKASAFRAVSMTPQTPRILEGPAPAVAMNSLAEFTIRTNGTEAERIEALYRTGNADVVHAAGDEMFDAVKVLRAANPQQYLPQNGAVYPPNSPFAQHLKGIAQLIKADVGLEIAFADVGGWDTHVNQGGSTGQLAQRLDDFAKAINALVTDLGDRMADVTIMTMSEFGRTAHQNGNGGTDHGHASALFVVGGDVKGGKIHGKWPGLEPEQLNEGRDLALTTDFRSVFSEVVSKHLGATKLDAIFPGFSVDQSKWVGLV